MANIVQRSFASGEVSPDLWYKSDFNSYLTGLRTCRNAFVRKQSGVQRRPGTSFVVNTKYSDKDTRLLPFQYSFGDVLNVEFGHEYFRFISYGRIVTDISSQLDITNVTDSTDPEYTLQAPHGLSNGDDIVMSIEFADNPPQTYNLKVVVVDATHIRTEPAIDSTGLSFVDGSVRTPYEVTHPFQEEDLFAVTFSQMGNILTLVHPSYGVFELTRNSVLNNSWSFSENLLQPNPYKPNDASDPIPCAVTGGTPGTAYHYDYLITAIDSRGSESFPVRVVSNSLTKAIDRDDIATFLTLTINGPYVPPASSGGIISYRIYRREAPRPAVPFLGGVPVPIPSTYSMYGFIAEIDTTDSAGMYSSVFTDNGTYTPDYSLTPSRPTIIYGEEIGMDYDGSNGSSFALDNLYPSAVAYSKDRRFFGGSFKYPEAIWGSAVSEFNNFTAKDPGQAVASDAVDLPSISENFGKIKHLLDYKRLIAFADFGEVILKGQDEYGSISAVGLPNPDKISTNGIGDVRPLIVDKSVLYVQARSGSVRDMFLAMAIDGYNGDEISINSAHLLERHGIKDWAYQKSEHPIVWSVRSDGAMLGLTYNPSQSMIAWHRHDFFEGKAISVSCLTENQSDMVYVIVRRGEDQYIERFDVVDETDDRLMRLTDCSFKTWSEDPSLRPGNPLFTLTAPSGWGYGQTLTLTADAGVFLSAMAGVEIHMYVDGMRPLRLTPIARVDYDEITVTADRDVEPEYQQPTRRHATAVNELKNLWHLEGREVAIRADGNIYGSPLNSDYDKYVVTNGTITLPHFAVMIEVGLPFITDIETLDFDTASRSGTYSNKALCVTHVEAEVKDTAQFYAGIEEPRGDDYLQGLYEAKIREFENYEEGLRLGTGHVEIAVAGKHRIGGRVFIRQVDPSPLKIITLYPNVAEI